LDIDLPRFGEIHSENWRQGVGVILRSGVFAASRRMAASSQPSFETHRYAVLLRMTALLVEES
jgi:hypothetical protein